MTLRLGLVWQEAMEPVAPVPSALPDRALVYPNRAQLGALQEVVTLGFYRGILNQLDALEAAQPECAGFVANMRELARQFQFEAMSQVLKTAVSPDQMNIISDPLAVIPDPLAVIPDPLAVIPDSIRDPGLAGSWIAGQARNDKPRSGGDDVLHVSQ